MTSKDFMSSSEAAKHLGISKMTLYRAAKKGVIKPALITPGGFYKYKEDDLNLYVSEKMGTYETEINVSKEQEE